MSSIAGTPAFKVKNSVQLERSSSGLRYVWSKHGRSKYKRFMLAVHTHSVTKGDWEPIRECVSKAASSSWWAWDLGSRPMFWQWKRNYSYDVIWTEDPTWKPPWARGRERRWARDGQPHITLWRIFQFSRSLKGRPEPQRIDSWCSQKWPLSGSRITLRWVWC